MRKTSVVVIGGGPVGVAILRDLAMRGVPAILVEQGSLARSTSSRFHGTLHSGARFAVTDPHMARDCVAEHAVLRRIARNCLEEGGGFFVRTHQDDPAYAKQWREACAASGVVVEAVDVEEARRLEGALSPYIKEVYRTLDTGMDGCRLIWHTALSARRHGGLLSPCHMVTGVTTYSGRVTGVEVYDSRKKEKYIIACEYLVNAAGPFAGEVARMAGLSLDPLSDKGTLVVFNHRFTSRVCCRLRRPSDGDVFVPLGSATVLGTASSPAQGPGDTSPCTDDVVRLMGLGEALFPHVWSYRILRAFAGTRPMHMADESGSRSEARGFAVVDHEREGLSGMGSVFGGKLTTHRLMAERMTDLVCRKLRVSAPCRTATEPLAAQPDPGVREVARRFFPVSRVPVVARRVGDQFGELVRMLEGGADVDLLCECEMVSRAEVELAARDEASLTLQDVRFRTRLGMGSCQGMFCAIRALGALSASGIPFALSPRDDLRAMMQERWQGVRPVLWGAQLRDIEFCRSIYAATLNLDGADDEAD